MVEEGGGGVDDALDAGPASSVIGARDPGGLVSSACPVPASAADWLDSEPLECEEPTLPELDELPQPLAEATPRSARTRKIRSAVLCMTLIIAHHPRHPPAEALRDRRARSPSDLRVRA